MLQPTISSLFDRQKTNMISENHETSHHKTQPVVRYFVLLKEKNILWNYPTFCIYLISISIFQTKFSASVYMRVTVD
jgi:hypothetical protein